MVPDRAPQYCSKILRKKFERDGDVRFVYLSRGLPYPHMIEVHWRQAKHHLLVSEYCLMFSDEKSRI